MRQEMPDFVEVTSEKLLDFIVSAKGKVIIAKPGYSKSEVEQLIKLGKEKKVKIELYLEGGDQATRFGFGDVEALNLIKDNIELLKVQYMNRIRMAMVIVDNKSLIFAPNISFMEEELIEMTFPNGLMGDKIFTEGVLKKLFYRQSSEQLNLYEENNKIILFPGCKLERNDDVDVKDKLEKDIKSLEMNPPTDPSKLRQVNFYRNNYKLVKMKMFGIKIKTKRINLKPFLSLLSDQNDRLISSWNVFSPEDVRSLQDTILFENEFGKVKKNYLKDAKRFGHILEAKKKKEFSDKKDKLLEDFLSHLKGESNEENVFTELKNENQSDNKNTNINHILKSSRKELMEYLLKVTNRDKVFMENILREDRNLRFKVEDNFISEEEAKYNFIESFIDNTLRFPCKEDIIDRVALKVDYYDISDELLESEDFQDMLKEYKSDNLQLRLYGTGYETNNT